jgi:hypothetical protein
MLLQLAPMVISVGVIDILILLVKIHKEEKS